MAEKPEDQEQQALKSWYQGLLERVSQDMLRIGAVTGSAVEARPVWAAPNSMLIARVWGAAQKSDFVWTISGEDVVTDHISGHLAVTAQEAARHFSMKWQMDAERLRQAASQGAIAKGTGEQVEAYIGKLIRSAETLYALSEQDDIWKNRIAG